eukprot:COSAG01_NODE_1879_length_8994_cov_5.920292_5_plen_94_part_00
MEKQKRPREEPNGSEDPKKPKSATAAAATVLAGPAATRLGGLQATPPTAGIEGAAELPGGVLMPWVGLGTCAKTCRHCLPFFPSPPPAPPLAP